MGSKEKLHCTNTEYCLNNLKKNGEIMNLEGKEPYCFICKVISQIHQGLSRTP